MEDKINLLELDNLSNEKSMKQNFNESDIITSFSPVANRRATEALQFYNIHNIQSSENNNKFDWNICRTYCRRTKSISNSLEARWRKSDESKSYSHARFMDFVAKWFNITVEEMKLQHGNINYK